MVWLNYFNKNNNNNNIKHLNVNVKKYNSRPIQCFNCYEFGHVKTKCTNEAKCYNYSKSHDLSEECSESKFCFNCTGTHSPNSKFCPRYKIEQTIINTANDEFISYGSARRKVMGANKSLDLSYAKTVKETATNRYVPNQQPSENNKNN